MFAGVMQGTPTTVVDFMLPLDRHGFSEECYFIFSYSPIRQENGQVGGVLVTVTESTQRVVGERRLKATQALAARTREAKTVHEACAISGSVLAEHGADFPFALIYLLDPQASAVLEGFGEASTAIPAHRLAWLCQQANRARGPSRRCFARAKQSSSMPAASLAGARQPATRAFVLPIIEHARGGAVGILVAGLSSRLMFDAAYGDFLTMVASQIGTAVASARALEEAQARAAALAELDRAKTAFFSNVSHEFRTPLTLMLGTDGGGARRPTAALQGEDLEAVHRNAQRLLKLVNTLLDFSRIEAGRVQASFEPTDLGTLTADLASAFRSAIERAD